MSRLFPASARPLQPASFDPARVPLVMAGGLDAAAATFVTIDDGTTIHADGGAETVWALNGGTGTSVGDGTEYSLAADISGGGTHTRFRAYFDAFDISNGGLAFEIETDAELSQVIVHVFSGIKYAYGIAYPYQFRGRQWLVMPLSALSYFFGGWASTDAEAVTSVRIDVFPSTGQASTLKLRRTVAWQGDGVGRVNFQFDDGRVDNYTTAYPILAANGYKGDISIALAYLNTGGFLTDAQVAELYAAGWGFTGHHTTGMTSLTEAQQRAIYVALKSWFSSNGYRRGDQIFVWPGGIVDAAADAVAAEYWTTRRTIVSATQYSQSYPRLFSPSQPSFRYIGSSTPLADLKALADAAAAHGSTVSYVFHSIKSPEAEGTDYDTDDFTELVEYCAALGLRDARLGELFEVNSLAALP